jgi:small-conductance mechanosensitive channel
VSVQTDEGFGPVWEAITGYSEPLEQAGWFAVGFVLVYVLGRVLVKPTVSRVIRTRNRNNPTLTQAIERYVEVFVLIVAVSVGVTVAGYGYVLTDSAIILAAVTLALGVAGQEVIGNLISGFFLVADPKFNVGDWIVWDDREGTVESITLRVTRVRTPENETVSVPNAELTTNAVTRPYGRQRYRVALNVGLDYDGDVDAALTALVEEARDVPGILDEPEPTSHIVDLSPDAVDLQVLYWVGNPSRRNLLEVRSAFARRVKQRFEDEGLAISPTPKLELEGRIEAGWPDADGPEEP